MYTRVCPIWWFTNNKCMHSHHIATTPGFGGLRSMKEKVLAVGATIQSHKEKHAGKLAKLTHSNGPGI